MRQTAGILLFIAFTMQAFSTTYTVTSTADAGAGTLRQAIIDANANAGADNIVFNTGSTTVAGRTITLSSALPTITGDLIIDASATAGAAFGSSDTKIIINGAGSNCLSITAPNVEIYNLFITNCNNGIIITTDNADNFIIGGSNKGNVISGNSTYGIYIADADQGSIYGNFIGIDTSEAALANDTGIHIISGDNNVIGSTTSGQENVISSNNGTGILVGDGVFTNGRPTGTIIQGNYIGTDMNGNADFGNGGDGILINIDAGNGSNTEVLNNYIGNNLNGINMYGEGLVVTGNYIGIGKDGSTDMGNTTYGIYTQYSSGSGSAPIGTITIGDGTNAGRNFISGNGSTGIYMDSDANTINKNYIGTNVAGTAALANGGDGINLSNIAENTSITNNLVSGNTGDGLDISGDNVIIQGNYIGTSINGISAIPNGGNGIISNAIADVLTIGGSSYSERNIVSGNTGNGISHDANNSTIKGNFIGINKNGNTLGNGSIGIIVNNSALNTIIGGNRSSGEGNVISNNGSDGIYTVHESTSIQGNYIGTDSTGTIGMGNIGNGISVVGNISSVQIGGAKASNLGNIIADNGGYGIYFLNVDQSYIEGNFIGTDASSSLDLGNTLDGVYIYNTSGNSNDNYIGSDVTDEGNVIAYNDGWGVRLNSFLASRTLQNRIKRNSMFCNASGGIQLQNGSNSNRIAPVINPGSIEDSIYGTASYAGEIIELFEVDPGCSDCQGAIFVDTVHANASGNWYLTGTFGTTKQYVATGTSSTNITTSPFSSCITPLPVKLISFTAKKVETSILLEWSTLSEINNDYFSVEKSTDDILYEKIGIVSGNGTSNVLNTYSFIDETPVIGLNYYRIVQYDYDGKNETFNPVVILFGLTNQAIIRQLDRELIIENIGTENDLIITTTIGKRCLQQKIDPSSNIINLSILNTGVYIVQVYNDNTIINKKIIIR